MQRLERICTLPTVVSILIASAVTLAVHYHLTVVAVVVAVVNLLPTSYITSLDNIVHFQLSLDVNPSRRLSSLRLSAEASDVGRLCADNNALIVATCRRGCPTASAKPYFRRSPKERQCHVQSVSRAVVDRVQRFSRVPNAIIGQQYSYHLQLVSQIRNQSRPPLQEAQSAHTYSP